MSTADKKDRSSKKTGVINLFGQVEEEMPVLKDRYSLEPFNILDTGSGHWNKRRAKWRQYLDIGKAGEEGRFGIQGEEIETETGFTKNSNIESGKGISSVKIAEEAVFDPFLLEVLADWYCPDGGSILDFFNGSHVSPGVFQTLGYKYTGIDIRQKIITQNWEKLKSILKEDNMPRLICGDSNKVLDNELIFDEFDYINSCPPYANLVKYSKNDPIRGDISLLEYDPFVEVYRSIIRKGCFLLKKQGYACMTIGQVRDKKSGELYPFLEDTIKAFKDCKMKHWNTAHLVGSRGSAGMRAKGTFERGMGKLVNVHQTILVFKKC